MKIAMYPTMPAAVKRYRFERARTHMDSEAEFFDIAKCYNTGNMMYDIKTFLRQHGAEWDVIWTNNYSPEGQALVEVLMDNGAKLVADVDDWFEEVPAGNLVVDQWQGKRKRWYEGLLNMADSVTCSTKKLHDRYGGTMCMNFIDPKEWDGPRRPESDYTLIACCSGVGRAGDYALAEKALKRALEIDTVKVIFVGYMPQWATSYPTGKVVWSRWSPIDTYPKILNYIAPDIMISPMEHCAFNEAKSNLKWIESGAIKACFLGEDWGEYRRTVKDGITGVLADGHDDWGEKLEWLCLDHKKRREIALAGHEEVMKNWTWDAVGDAWRKGVLISGKVSSEARDQLCA